jgi:hypothetical protein
MQMQAQYIAETLRAHGGFIADARVVRHSLKYSMIYKPQTRHEHWFWGLPQGIWFCGDGREVLHNSEHVPLWERYPGQPARPADPTEWVTNIVASETIFIGGSFLPAVQVRNNFLKMNAVLVAWGLPKAPPRPTNNSNGSCHSEIQNGQR